MATDENNDEVVDVQDDDQVQETVNDNDGDVGEAPAYKPPAATNQDPEDPEQGGYTNPDPQSVYEEPAPDGVPAQSDAEAYDMKVNGCIVALIVASCAELAQAAKVCSDMKDLNPNFECNKAYLWAILLGAISLGFNLIFGLGLWFRPLMFKPYVQYLAILMVLMWGFGVAVCTFDKPFETTGNGYFAVWGAAIISLFLAQITFSKFNAVLGKAFTNALSGTIERRVMMVIMIFSYVFAFASLTSDYQEIDSSDFSIVEWTPQEKWGFSCGIISGAMITIYMLLKAFTGLVTGNVKIVRYMSYVLVLLWLFGVGVCTFEAPFTTTGNGYFTAWGSFVASIYLAYITTANPTTETPAVQ